MLRKDERNANLLGETKNLREKVQLEESIFGRLWFKTVTLRVK